MWRLAAVYTRLAPSLSRRTTFAELTSSLPAVRKAATIASFTRSPTYMNDSGQEMEEDVLSATDVRIQRTIQGIATAITAERGCNWAPGPLPLACQQQAENHPTNSHLGVGHDGHSGGARAADGAAERACGWGGWRSCQGGGLRWQAAACSHCFPNQHSSTHPTPNVRMLPTRGATQRSPDKQPLPAAAHLPRAPRP